MTGWCIYFNVLAYGVFTLTVGYKTPHSIASLLSAVEIEEIQKDRFSLRSPEYFTAAKRFTSLLKPAHASLLHRRDSPTCLDKNNSAAWLAYDTHCSFALTPSEYCCQTFAEQACIDPEMTMEQSTAIVNERLSGLGGAGNPFLYDKCMMDNCSAPCSLAEGSDEACKICATVCQRSCLANLQLLCLKRVCGQNIITLAEKAMLHHPNSNNYLLHEQTEELVRQKLRIGKQDLRDIEKSEIVEFVLRSLEKEVSVPLCEDSKLIGADRAAGVFVNSAGTTFAESLLTCTDSILKPEMITRISSDPTILGNSEECRVASACERDHVKLAADRAIAQVDIFKKRREQASSV